ncbi:hypothetical protein K439DRAFT_1558153 [Ramaria rubella]|nr:hypothetical protein K439DRAFT_1558153 [Ramaria rubella]
MAPMEHPAVDVLIVGGGPTGLISTYALLKAGLSVLTLEQHDKAQQAMYGRACMLYPRSLELLDQVGLFDSIADSGYIIRGAVTYKGRQELKTRGWTFIQEAIDGNTHFDYCFSIRQKISEEAFREKVRRLDPGTLRTPVQLLDFSVDNSQDHPVLARVSVNGSVVEIRSKYLIGADGGRSTVRSVAKIPFPGVASPFRWIRMDAIVRTDMPSGRKGGVSIESPSHGNILWTPTDNGRTRIGFICPEELFGENGEDLDANSIMIEAQKALRPFSLEFVELDWWTAYAIGQRVAERFRQGPILLAGDAGHTHSSGAAQGMNTGIHDATNLSWKLAGVIKGWYTDTVLDTYATERRESALQLIQLDKDISSLISGVIPAHFNAPPDADVNHYLDETFRKSATFTVGLGIHYSDNLINWRNESMNDVMQSLRIQIGHRAPDPLLFRPGSNLARRLEEFTPNQGKFWILIFAGGLDPTSDQPRLRQSSIDKLATLRSYILGPSSFVNRLSPAFEFLTIVQSDRILQIAETLDGQPLGRAVYDRSGEAYEMYGVEETVGALIVLRPDGIVAFLASMDQYERVEQYFTRFVRPRKSGVLEELKVDSKPPTKIAFGEISLEGKVEESKFVPTL